MPEVRTRTVLRLAVPAALSVILNNAFRVIDQYAAGWLGTSAQAAIGSFVFVLILCFSVWELVAAGAGPLIARATGAGDGVLRARVLGNALSGAAVLGVGVLALCAVFADTIAGLVGLSGEPAALAATYLRWLCVVGLPWALAPVVDAAFIAMGHTALPMALQVVATVLNLALNALFVLVLDLGIAGLALASGLSRLVAVSVGLVVLWRLVRPGLVDLVPVAATLRRIGRIGAPIAANTAFYALVYWALLKVAISPLGPAVNAGLGIGFSALEGFTWPLFHGISLAVASLVGRSLGAGDVAGARAAARKGLPVSTVAGVGASLAFWFGAEPLCAAFTDDPAVLTQAVLYARILAFSQLFVAWETLAEGVLAGAGDTRTVLAWSAPFNVLRVPLAWGLALGLGWGAAGVWWAINLSSWIKAAGKGAAVIRGRWTEVEV